ncbi:MAG: hypothetical protein D6693_05675 [Planctomycetota bacterium]|nr:MAG: hypothetical protein D6693_05675 [Planctomycetota bacterium]
MSQPTHPAIVCALTVALAAAPGASAQPADPRAAGAPETVTFADLPPAIRLGVRVENTRRLLPVARTLVIVPDAGAFLDAVARWSLASRFPILIDDGSDRARDNIARFVRAFEPERVLRWGGDGTHDLTRAEPADARRAALASAAARAWGARSAADLPARWAEVGLDPPGVALASLADRAWPAAVALSAGRGEPIVWLDDPGGGPLGGTGRAAWFDGWAPVVAGALDETPWAWRDLGDTIDSVTLCLTVPARVRLAGGDGRNFVSITDLLPRHAGGARWGWAGLIAGDEAESLWRAMCALFLQPKSAWLADAYRDRPGFARYQIAPAADLLGRVGLGVRADEDITLAQWRAAARAGVSADVVHVSTSNGVYGFKLFDALAPASDTPTLWTPAVVHLIHSFSAGRLDDRRSLARRWLDEGAYVYVGSVYEPFLTAFHTPQSLAQRWLAPAPFGAAVMHDAAPPWRLVYLGDPLVTVGPEAPAAPMPDLPGAEDAEVAMRQALAAGDLESGLRGLVTLARDADAARLVRALLDDRPEAVTGEIARLGWRPLVRTGQSAALIALMDHLGPEARDDPDLTDVVWLALRPLATAGDAGAVAALSTRLRELTFGADATDLARGVRAARGADAARRYLTALRTRAPDDRAREIIDAALADLAP